MAVSNATGAGAALSNGCAINERLRRVALSANVAARCMKVEVFMGCCRAISSAKALGILPLMHGATILRAGTGQMQAKDHTGIRMITLRVSVVRVSVYGLPYDHFEER